MNAWNRLLHFQVRVLLVPMVAMTATHRLLVSHGLCSRAHPSPVCDLTGCGYLALGFLGWAFWYRGKFLTRRGITSNEKSGEFAA